MGISTFAGKIFCHGRLIEAVNRLMLFNDSKTFVDLPLKYHPDSVFKKFNDQFPPNLEISEEHAPRLRRFIEENFEELASELVECKLKDWTESPAKFSKIPDKSYNIWAHHLHEIWKDMCRKTHPKVAKSPEKYTQIPLPHSFVVPGGRFQEVYYWDTYFTIRGLLVSELYDTVKSQLRTFAHMVQRFGFVPNANRIYYLKRSQPPLLIPMAHEYYESATKSGKVNETKQFIREILPQLRAEFDFWWTNRSYSLRLNGEMLKLARFSTVTNTPRPESYRVDVENAENITTFEEKCRFWRNVATAAESGRDFGSRWFFDRRTLQTIQIDSILPVDLNAILCWNADILQHFYKLLGDQSSSEELREMKETIQETVRKVFYNETMGAWFDYSITERRQLTDQFYPANVVPLTVGCYDKADKNIPLKAYKYLQQVGALNFPGGIPASLVRPVTGEQWDFPNGWSPQNVWVIDALRNSGVAEMKLEAEKQAAKIVATAYNVWKTTGFMWEKYNVEGVIPKPGDGGEYDVQKGFGWTNGAVLHFLYLYGDKISPKSASLTNELTSASTPIHISWQSKALAVVLPLLLVLCLATL